MAKVKIAKTKPTAAAKRVKTKAKATAKTTKTKPAAAAATGAAKAKPAAKVSPAAKATAKATGAAKATPAAKATASAKPASVSTQTAPATKAAKVSGDGTAAKPWQLTTPPGSSAFIAYRDGASNALVCKVGSTTLSYQLRCIDDLHAMLKAHGDWMPLGGTDEQKPAPAGSVEAWGRDAGNPVGGWYGIKKGFRGRFGVYVPPVLEALGLAEVEHGARNNRMRAR